MNKQDEFIELSRVLIEKSSAISERQLEKDLAEFLALSPAEQDATMSNG